MLDESDQLAVIRGLRAGSRDAWARLYDGYSPQVWRYVARLLGSDAAAVADVVQETFLAAAASARGFDPARGSLWGWLCGIAHHRVAAHWRQHHRVLRLRTSLEHETTGDGATTRPGRDGAAAAIAAEEAELVRIVLAELPPDYAAILIDKYTVDRTLADLAAAGASTVEAVKSKLARARREFRAVYDRKCEAPAPARSTSAPDEPTKKS